MEVVYLDMCCLKRPFDDQRSLRIQEEAAAVATLLECAERGQVSLVRSPAHDFENGRNPREDRRLAAAVWIEAAALHVPFSEASVARARELAARGFGALDALHTAFAEAAGAVWLATTDDRLIRLGSQPGVLVSIANPVRVARLVQGGAP